MKQIQTIIIKFFLCLLLIFGVVFIVFPRAIEEKSEEHSNIFIDSNGRQFIPRGFVMNTEDGLGELFYTDSDYMRAARLGANFQVIRLNLGKVGGWPSHSVNHNYLQKLDSMVALGDKYGMKTGFKMTVYSTQGFSWNELWLNEKQEHDYLIKAWKNLWLRYKDSDAVFAYDLLNEPMIGSLSISPNELQKSFLIPLYKKLIDKLKSIDTIKWAGYQPILLEQNPDRAKRIIPFYEMKIPIDRSKVVYMPHIYQLELSKINPTINQYLKDSKLNNISVPILLGEWGSATYDETDFSITEQQRYQRAYIRTAELADSLKIGMIKAWFMGSRWKGRNHIGNFTWSIFKDSTDIGITERKYITDIIARPYPSKIAGKIHYYEYDFSSREFHLGYTSIIENEISEIFVGANRHFPDGFTLFINGDIHAIWDPLVSMNELQKLIDSKYIKAKWNEHLQILELKHNDIVNKTYHIDIIPGTFYWMFN